MQAVCLAISNSGKGTQIRNTLIRAKIRAGQLLAEEASSASFNRSRRERWVIDFCSFSSSSLQRYITLRLAVAMRPLPTMPI
jgi:hypothetical protein